MEGGVFTPSTRPTSRVPIRVASPLRLGEATTTEQCVAATHPDGTHGVSQCECEWWFPPFSPEGVGAAPRPLYSR